MAKSQKIMLRIKKSLLFIALGVIFAQGAILLTPKNASAKAKEECLDNNGSCRPMSGYICGLNGQNYPDKAYQ